MNNKRLSDIEIEIMRYAAGGMTGNKTYHQVRDQFMPMDSESMGYANGGGVGSMMQPKKKTLKAVNELQAKAPEGEFLAYINQGEANALKNSGGSGHLVNGIPSFVGSSYSGAGNANTSGYQGGMRGSGGYQGSKGGINSTTNSGGSGNFTTPTYTPPSPPEDIDSTYTANSFNTTPKTNTGIFSGGFNPLAMILGLINPFLGIAARGIGSLKGGFAGLNKTLRGTNPDGTTRTQAEYEKARFDRQQTNRLDKLYAAKDRGYNQIGFGNFTKKTMDFTPGQQAKIDGLLAQGYEPSTARNVLTGRDLGLRNTLAANNMTKSMPKANITGLNNNDFDGVTGQDRSITSGQIDEFQNQLGGMNLNDYETGNPGGMVQPNDFLTGDPSQYGLNSNSINEFGDNRNINIDEFATQNNIDNRLMQEYLTDQAGFQQPITASQINEFGDKKNIQEQFPVRSDFNVEKIPNAQGYNFVEDFQTEYMKNTGKVPNEFTGYNEMLNNPKNYNINPDNLRVDASQTLPGNDIFAFNPGSIKDRQLKQAYGIYEATGMEPPNLKSLMQEDVESGGQLSLPQNAYSLIG